MDENLPDIDKLFKEALDNYTETPPGFAWEGIHANLEGSANPGGKPASGFSALTGLMIFAICMVPPVPARMPALKGNQPVRVNPMAKLPEKSIKQGENTLVLKSLDAAREQENYPGKQPQYNQTEGKNGKGLNSGMENVQPEEPLDNSVAGRQTKTTVRETQQQHKKEIIRQETYFSPANEPVKTAAEKTITNINREITQDKNAGKQTNTPNDGKKGKTPLISADVFAAEGGNIKAPGKALSALQVQTDSNNAAAQNAEQFIAATPEEKDEEALQRRVSQNLLSGSHVKTVPSIDAGQPISWPGNGLTIPVSASKQGRQPFKTGWTFSGYYRPEWQQQSLGRLENDRHDGPRNDRHAIKKQQTNVSSYTAGLTAGLQLKNGLMIESGFSLLSQTATLGRQVVRARADSAGRYNLRLDFAEGYCNINLKNGTPPAAGDSLLVAGATTQIKYLGIPVQLSYPFRFGRFYAVPSAGVTFQMQLSGTFEAEVRQGQDKVQYSEKSITGLKSNFLSGQAGLGLEYRLSPGLRLQLNPTYRFAFNPVNKGAAVQYYPAAWGVGMGLRWTPGK